MARLVLHIGIPKTGTTSIQAMLVNSKEILSSKYHIKTFSSQQRGFDLALPFLKNLQEHKGYRVLGVNVHNRDTVIDNTLKTYKKFFIDESQKDVILSFESLWSLKKEEILNLKQFLMPYFDEIMILVYIRDIEKLVISAVSQIIKQGLETDDINTLTDRVIDNILYNKNTDLINVHLNSIWKWIEVFGEENVCIRVFNKDQFYDKDLISDFFYYSRYENVDTKELNKPVVNEGIGLVSTKFLSQYNQKYAIYNGNQFNQQRGNIGKLTPRVMFQQMKEEKFKIDVFFSKDQADKYNEDIKQINHMITGDGKLEEIKASDKENYTEEIDNLPIDYAVELFNEACKVLGQNENKINYQAHIINQQKNQIIALKKWLGVAYNMPGIQIKLLDIFKKHAFNEVAIYGARDVVARIIFLILSRCHCDIKYLLTDSKQEFEKGIVVNGIKTIMVDKIDKDIQCVIVSSGDDAADRRLKQKIKSIVSTKTFVYIWNELI